MLTREQRQWRDRKNYFLKILENETDRLIENMKEQYPDTDTQELIKLVDETYRNSYKRVKLLMVGNFPQYAAPFKS